MILFNKNMDFHLSIFNKNNCLYIKNTINKIKKVSNNVYLYSAVIDSLNQVHICILSNKNYINYYTYYNDNLNLIFSSKLNINYNKLYKLSIQLLKNSINIFFCKSSNKDSYDIFHMNYNFYSFELIDFNICKAFKSKLYTIKNLNNNIVCSYYIKTNNTINLNSMIFNDNEKSWSKFSNIKTNNLLFSYCDTIKY